MGQAPRGTIKEISDFMETYDVAITEEKVPEDNLIVAYAKMVMK